MGTYFNSGVKEVPMRYFIDGTHYVNLFQHKNDLRAIFSKGPTKINYYLTFLMQIHTIKVLFLESTLFL